jgi:quinoprotein glucose dehydrogenase
MRTLHWSKEVMSGVLLVAFLTCTAAAQQKTETDWPAYGNDPGGMRYSPLTQINHGNVDRLKVAWTFHTGDISDGRNGWKRSGLETTPILVDGTLYLTTAFNRVIALDPATGRQRWAFDPQIDRSLDYGDGLINRGVSTWLDSSRPEGQPCRRRIYEATLDARLVALDAATGKPCADFGGKGEVQLANVPGYGDRARGGAPARVVSHDLATGGNR